MKHRLYRCYESTMQALKAGLSRRSYTYTVGELAIFSQEEYARLWFEKANSSLVPFNRMTDLVYSKGYMRDSDIICFYINQELSLSYTNDLPTPMELARMTRIDLTNWFWEHLDQEMVNELNSFGIDTLIGSFGDIMCAKLDASSLEPRVSLFIKIPFKYYANSCDLTKDNIVLNDMRIKIKQDVLDCWQEDAERNLLPLINLENELTSTFYSEEIDKEYWTDIENMPKVRVVLHGEGRLDINYILDKLSQYYHFTSYRGNIVDCTLALDLQISFPSYAKYATDYVGYSQAHVVRGGYVIFDTEEL